MRWTLIACSVVACFAAATARAQTPSDRAAAEALFQDGRRLLAEGNFVEACAKLETSQRLDPGVGTLLNLADCYDRLGRTASAWITFRDAAVKARNAGQGKRATVAKQRADALEKKLARLTITVAKGGDLPGRIVQRDGEPIDHHLWGTPVAVDPGPHVIELSGPAPPAARAEELVTSDGWQVKRDGHGGERWRRTVEVPAARASLTVTIPEVAVAAPKPVVAVAAPKPVVAVAAPQKPDDPPVSVAPAEPIVPAPAQPAIQPASPSTNADSGGHPDRKRAIGLGLVAGGAAVAIAGAVLLIYASSVYGGADGAPTDGERQSRIDGASNERLGGALLAAVGGVAAIAGVAVVVLARRDRRTALWIAPTGPGFAAGGSF